MKPLDPRLLRHASAARRFVILAAATAVLTAGLVLVQAQLLAGGVTRAFLGGAGLTDLAPLLVALLVVVGGRAGLAWLGEVAAHRASTDVDPPAAVEAGHPRAAVGPTPPRAPTGRRARDAGHPRPGRAGGVLQPLPADPARRRGGARRRRVPDPVRRPAGRGDRRTDGAAHPDLHDPRRAAHRTLHAAAVAGPGRARPPLPRPRRGPRRAGRVRPGTPPVVAPAHAGHGIPAGDHADAAGRVPLRARPGTAGHPLGRADRRVGRVAPGRGPPRPVDRPGRAHPRPGGLPAAARCGCPLPRLRGRPRRRVRGRSRCWRRRRPAVPVGSRRPTRPGSRSAWRAWRSRAGQAGSSAGVDLLLEPGTVLGVRGPSGGGKSTLVDLLLGLRTPDEGRVLVGGVDLADVDRDAWLRRIAWVPQRPTLVRGTVADNIRLGQTLRDPGTGRGSRRGGRARHPARHPASARTGTGCPPASNVASRSPGPSSPTGPSCCSTSRPKALTPTPKRRSSRRSTGSRRDAPSCWSATGRSCSPCATGCSRSTPFSPRPSRTGSRSRRRYYGHRWRRPPPARLPRPPPPRGHQRERCAGR